MSKGSTRRPSSVGREEYDLNYSLATGHITFEEYRIRYLQLKKEGKITRKF